MEDEKEKIIALNRWRLVLGKFSENQIDFNADKENCEGYYNDVNYREMDDVLEFLYGREYDEDRGMRGGLEASQLTVPSWLTKMRKLFPKSTVEILEKHALNKYELTELLTDKEVMEKLEPNIDLLKNILQLKHMMKGEVLETARRIVKTVADEITKRLQQDVKNSIMGKIDRNKSSSLKSARNFDFKRTISKNLKNYNTENNQLVIDKVYFNQRVKRYNPWDIIIAVDESGSMLGSVIHSAIMAGIFAKLPVLKTKLIIFDTEVVDLTKYIDDPVETLMSVQLGGGTNIAKALGYAYSQIENPHKSIVVLVTDLCEGGNYQKMYSRAKDIIESGSKLIILTSLDANSVPVYDRNAAAVMAGLGAEVAALTPEGLAKWIAEIIS